MTFNKFVVDGRHYPTGDWWVTIDGLQLGVTFETPKDACDFVSKLLNIQALARERMWIDQYDGEKGGRFVVTVAGVDLVVCRWRLADRAKTPVLTTLDELLDELCNIAGSYDIATAEESKRLDGELAEVREKIHALFSEKKEGSK